PCMDRVIRAYQRTDLDTPCAFLLFRPASTPERPEQQERARRVEIGTLIRANHTIHTRDPQL
ncbi:hypothetical protein, partial [Nocardiopsis sp. SBT366]|uniref:hypothetical protein n=1 Tax=Nocardiopsis sp. SBT366 TaxID=1580529 RepID=UPI001F1AF247